MSNDNKRKIIARQFDCDTEFLYGSLDTAIKYLTKIREENPGKDISLYEHWTGYEDMDMVFMYTSPETDDEYKSRLAAEARHRRELAAESKAKKARANAQKEFNRLKNKYNFR